VKKKILSITLVIFITLILLEVGAAVLLRLDLLHGDIPTYTPTQALEQFWVDRSPDFGVWHSSNSKYRHHKSCFNVLYTANSHGMRDRERTIQSDKKRVVVLGDSLIEGYGLPEQFRLTNLLEAASGVEYLNFGTSGNFGPTQYYLLYKTLAKKFTHDEIMIGIYPRNDFSDDNYEDWKDKDRYRPFWIGKYPNYSLVYTKNFPLGKFHYSRFISKFLQDFTHLYSAVGHLIDRQNHRLPSHLVSADGELYSGFYKFTPEDFDRLRFSLEKIQSEVDGRKITLVLIPAPEDFIHYRKYGPSPLQEKLTKFAKDHSMKLINLLPEMNRYSQSWEKNFLPCDSHLSEYGSQVAFQIIKKELSALTAGFRENKSLQNKSKGDRGII